MRISDWSSDVCSSDLDEVQQARQHSRREGIERHRDDVPEGRYERRSADHAGRACIGGRWLTGGYSSPNDLKLAWQLRPMMTRWNKVRAGNEGVSTGRTRQE